MKSGNMNILDKIRDWLGIAVYAISIIIGLYVSIWVMLVEPIIYACQCFDAGTLTATIIGITIIKISLSGFVGILIMFIRFAIAFFISNR
jgi:hypothetical protein